MRTFWIILTVAATCMAKGSYTEVVTCECGTEISRTEGKGDGLDTAILLPKNDNSDLKIVQNELTLEPDDEIIVLMLTKN